MRVIHNLGQCTTVKINHVDINLSTQTNLDVKCEGKKGKKIGKINAFPMPTDKP